MAAAALAAMVAGGGWRCTAWGDLVTYGLRESGYVVAWLGWALANLGRYYR